MTTKAATPTTPEPIEEEIEEGIDFLAGSDELDGEIEGEGGGAGDESNPAGGDENVTPAASATPEATPPVETPAVTPEAKPGEPPAPVAGKQEPAVVAAQVPPGQAAPAPVPAAQAPAAQPAVAGQQPQEQQTPTTPAASEQPQGDYLTQVRGEIDKNRQVFTNLLAEKTYAMSEEESRTLFEDPGKVLPQLAAKVHLEVVQNVLGTLGNVLPHLVSGIQAANAQNQSYLDQFWNAHPTLDRKADHASVMQIAQLFRAQHPNASFEEFTKTVGNIAMVQLNKLPVAAQAAPVAAPAARVAPGAQAFTPAANGAPPAPQAKPTGEAYWGAFAQELDEV